MDLKLKLLQVINMFAVMICHLGFMYVKKIDRPTVTNSLPCDECENFIIARQKDFI